jgi:hypothetical protein
MYNLEMVCSIGSYSALLNNGVTVDTLCMVEDFVIVLRKGVASTADNTPAVFSTSPCRL